MAVKFAAVSMVPGRIAKYSTPSKLSFFSDVANLFKHGRIESPGKTGGFQGRQRDSVSLQGLGIASMRLPPLSTKKIAWIVSQSGVF
jgi:hypothetical protein